MATFVVCSRCGRVQEIRGIDQYPPSWGCADSALLCPRCVSAIAAVRGPSQRAAIVIPTTDSDTFEENCAVCRGPCRGH